MKHLLTLLLAALCAATSYGQTIKSLGFNSTNGQVIAATNLVWTNAFNFSTNTVAEQVRTNLGLGATWLTNTNVTNFRTAIGLGLVDSPTFDTITTGTNGISVGTAAARFSQSTGGGGAAIGWQGNSQRISFIGSVGMRLEESGLGIAFGASNTNGAAITRTNLGLGNGITTDRTFVSYNGTNYTTNSVSISNGVITGWTQ
jgi:hypothetical protein